MESIETNSVENQQRQAFPEAQSIHVERVTVRTLLCVSEKKGKRMGTTVLTASPYKNELLQRLEKKTSRRNEGNKKKHKGNKSCSPKLSLGLGISIKRKTTSSVVLVTFKSN